MQKEILAKITLPKEQDWAGKETPRQQVANEALHLKATISFPMIDFSQQMGRINHSHGKGKMQPGVPPKISLWKVSLRNFGPRECSP